MLTIKKGKTRGPSKIRRARPDDPIFTRGYVIGGQPPNKAKRSEEASAEALELAKLIQSAPVAPDEQTDSESKFWFETADGRLGFFNLEVGPVEVMPDGTERPFFPPSMAIHPETEDISEAEFWRRMALRRKPAIC